MNRPISILICLFLFFGCCHLKESDTNPKAKDLERSKALNDSAFVLIQEFYQNQDSSLLDKSRVMLNEAILADSANISAYSNAIIVLGLKNDYKSIIEITKRMLDVFENKSYAFVLEMGAYYEMNDTVSADSICKEAMQYYDMRINEDQSNIDVIDDMVAFLEFTKGVTFAEKVLDSCIELYPSSELLQNHKKRLSSMQTE